MLSTYENRLFFPVVIAVFFGSNSQRINNDIPSCPQRFYFKEVVAPKALLLTKRISTLTAFSIPRSTGDRYHADVWGNRLPFPPKTKNNFSGFPANALNVPLCPLIFSWPL